MTEEEGEEDLSKLIYDMGKVDGYDIHCRVWYMEWRCYKNSKLPNIHKQEETLQTPIKLPNIHKLGGSGGEEGETL